LQSIKKVLKLSLINEDTTMPPNTERITSDELNPADATRLMLDAVHRATRQSSESGNFRVADGNAAGTIAVNRHPLVKDEGGRMHETRDYIEACVGPRDKATDTSFWKEETVIGIDCSRDPNLTFKKGEKEWTYGSENPPKKFVVKALTRLGLDSLKR